MFRSLRSLMVILQALSLLAPLLSKGRRLKFPLILKELTVLILTNSDLAWKLLEKRHLSPEFLKRIFSFKKK